MALRLILGDDPVLVGEAVSKAVDELIGDGDRSLMLETLTEAEYRTEEGTFEPARLIDRCPNSTVLDRQACCSRPSREPVGTTRASRRDHRSTR